MKSPNRHPADTWEKPLTALLKSLSYHSASRQPHPQGIIYTSMEKKTRWTDYFQVLAVLRDNLKTEFYTLDMGMSISMSKANHPWTTCVLPKDTSSEQVRDTLDLLEKRLWAQEGLRLIRH